MRFIHRWAAGIVLVFVSVALAQPEPATAPGAKDTVTVKRAKLSATVDADGYFEPIDALEIRIRPEAYQGDLKIHTAAASGAVVKRGDTLLEIDATQLQKQLAAAENEAATAQANLTKAEADVSLGDAADALAMRIAESELSNAEAGLKWWEQVDGAHMIKGADLGVKMASANVEDQSDELDQLKKMYKSEELTSATADIVVKRAIRQLELAGERKQMSQATAEKVKQFDYQTARQKLAFGIEREQQELAQLKALQDQQRAIRNTTLTGARLAADKAATRVSELRDDLVAFTVKAPADGIVYLGQFNRGVWQNSDPRTLRADEKVPAGQVVMTVITPGKMRVVADVPEARIGMLKPGLPVRIIPVGLPSAVTTGTCGAPATAGIMRESGQVFPTPIDVTKLDARIRPGEKAQVRIDAGTAEDVLVVPVSAISRGRVKVQPESGEPQWRDVVLGRTDGEMVEVLDGLKEGEQVISKPVTR